jgi:linoleoyl-CoA desaturase
MGLLKEKGTFSRTLLNIILWKVAYFGLVLVLPIISTSFPAWLILLAFLAQHFVTGLGLTLVFQLAHVVPSTSHPQPNEDGMIEEEWALHQMATTCNFAPKSNIMSWLVGGLNYQIEHHLFPNVCHVHYKKIAPIVKKTADELGIPYLSERTFFTALRGHFLMLKGLGQNASNLTS